MFDIHNFFKLIVFATLLLVSMMENGDDYLYKRVCTIRSIRLNHSKVFYDGWRNEKKNEKR